MSAINVYATAFIYFFYLNKKYIFANYDVCLDSLTIFDLIQSIENLKEKISFTYNGINFTSVEVTLNLIIFIIKKLIYVLIWTSFVYMYNLFN